MKHGTYFEEQTGEWHVVYRVPGCPQSLSSVYVCPDEQSAKIEARRLNVLHDHAEADAARQRAAQTDRRLARGWYTDEDAR